jgi:hypothetical protein
MGAGEGSAPLLSRVILRVRGDRGADSSVSPQTERTNDAAIPARPRNGMSLFWRFPYATQVSGQEFTPAETSLIGLGFSP